MASPSELLDTLEDEAAKLRDFRKRLCLFLADVTQQLTERNSDGDSGTDQTPTPAGSARNAGRHGSLGEHH
jgi:hypothetical protein